MELNKTQKDFLSLSDLTSRYNKNKQIITKYFFASGLPHQKIGNQYKFDVSELEDWEIKLKEINLSKGEKYFLPAFLFTIDKLKEEYFIAEQNKDDKKTEELLFQLLDLGIDKLYAA